MKVVVSCDAIIERDYYIEIVESVLDVLGDQSELYTLVHREKAVLGTIEQRKIHSTFLTHKVESYSDLLSLNFLIPGAARNLFIPCTVDLVINISRGFSHGIKTCEKTKVITFIVEDLNTTITKKSWRQKIFSSFVKSFQKESFKVVDEIWASRKELVPKEFWTQIKVVPPAVKLLDYKILPDALFNRDYFVINAEALDYNEALSYLKKFKEHAIKFKFIGKDDHLHTLKKNNEECFFGDRCGGELAPLLAGTVALIDTEKTKLPIYTLKTLACGRPVYAHANDFLDFGEGRYPLDQFSFDVQKMLEVVFDKNKARAQAVHFEELKFKHLIDKVLKVYSSSLNSF